MKKRFLPFSLLLVTMLFGQSVMAAPNGYVTRDDNPIYWHSMGPSNMSGRTTSVVFDNQTNKHVYVGTMGGGVFYSWNNGLSWHQVGLDLMVSCLVQDEDGTIYVGTGEGYYAQEYNGMSDMGYSNGMLGSGLYMIKDKVMTPIPSTTPEMNAIGEWSFINDIAIVDNKLVVATPLGLKYLSLDKVNDANATWTYAKSGDEELSEVDAQGLEVTADGELVAAVNGKFYFGDLDDLKCHSASAVHVNEDNVIDSIPTAAGLLDIATSPSDANIIYAACITTSGNHASVYLSEDKGATWRIALPAADNNYGHQIYEARGLFNNGMKVNPADPYCVYVTGYNLWCMTRSASDPEGYFMVIKISDGNNDNIFYNTYLHSGLNAMTFDPRDSSVAYIGTDGGVYKIHISNNTPYPTFENCNRGLTSGRCFGIAPSGNLTRVVAGVLDHGPVLIDGQDATNHNGYAVPLYPANDPSVYGNFSDTEHGGGCAVSTISPNTFFLVSVSKSESDASGVLKRTETAGVDYDASNFENSNLKFAGYRMPIALWESYDYENSADSVWFKCKKNQKAGDVVQCFSNNGSYPFDYTLPHNMHFNEEEPLLSDSILVKDPIASKFYVADGYHVFFTRDALQFNKVTTWYELTEISDAASCIAVSADGDMVLVGTRTGHVIRITNMNAAVDDATSTSGSEDFAPVITEIELPVDGRAITSLSISNNNKKVIATVGNYGYDSYVFFSNNANASAPEFVSKQGDLPLMPVYSSVYEMTTGHVLLGTEHGVYRAKSMNGDPTWEKVDTNMGDVPVMELKQQTIYHETQYVPMVVDANTTVMVPYAGVNNQGVIYGATYGRGLFRCETYRLHSGDNVPEMPVQASKLEVYPNPVNGAAKVRFNLNQPSAVSYQVYDLVGRMVKVENLGTFGEGSHEISVSVDGLATGAYVLRLNAGGNTSSVKFMIQ